MYFCDGFPGTVDYTPLIRPSRHPESAENGVYEEGLFVGSSTGNNVAAAERIQGPGMDHRHRAVRCRRALPVPTVQPPVAEGETPPAGGNPKTTEPQQPIKSVVTVQAKES